MKPILKTTLVAFLLIAFSCSKDDSPAQLPQQIISPPTVTNMSPLSGPKTTIVTFTGTNFGDDINTVQVFFDDIEATVQSVTETQIQTIVPPRAFLGEVRLVINGTEFTGFNFEYEIVDIQVSTFAGSTFGNTNGNGTNAQFAFPFGLELDASGNLYVADASNHSIRKISFDGTVNILAGNGTIGSADGSGLNATFNFPLALTTDSSGNVYVADTFNHKIRKITPSGIVSTFAGSTQGFTDGNGSDAQFFQPLGIAVDAADNVYVSDTFNNSIRKITPDGTVTTLAGNGAIGHTDGIGTNAQFRNPSGLIVDASSNIYVADAANHKIRKITTDGMVTTLAGNTAGFADGIGTNAQFSIPNDITIDALGNLYVSESGNDRIRKIDTNGQVTTVAGTNEGFTNGIGANARFNTPAGIIIDNDFNIYVADADNNKIRKITQE